MSIAVCKCPTIGAPEQLVFCDKDHRYWYGTRELASCSRVIRDIFPKKSWDGVDSDVVERARIRGERVDRYATEYIRTGAVTLNGDEWEEVRDRFKIVRKWIDAAAVDKMEAQTIVYDLEDGVAATKDFDLYVGGQAVIVDLKNTYQAEAAWKLQLGCQVTYTHTMVNGLYVLHVNPKIYREGCRMLQYDIDECRTLWNKGVTWWKAMKEL